MTLIPDTLGPNQHSPCFFCEETAIWNPSLESDTVECPSCGRFYITKDLALSMGIDGDCFIINTTTPKTKIPINAFRSVMFERQIGGAEPIYFGVRSDPIKKAVGIGSFFEGNTVPNTPMEKVERLLLNCARKSAFKAGAIIDEPYKVVQKMAFAEDEEEAQFIADAADKYDLMKLFDHSGVIFMAQISITGWKNLHEQNQTQNSSQAFIACDFKEFPYSSIEAIRAAIKIHKYDPRCLKGENYGETIIEKALSEIRKSKFVVADLSFPSESVIFEIGFAMGLGIEVILVMNESKWTTREKEGGKMEFYVKHYLIQRYKTDEELKSILEAAIGARVIY